MNPAAASDTTPLNSNIISPQDFGRSLISVRDAMGLFHREIGPNERPFTASLISLNNGLVERWKNEVLNNMADNKGYVEAEMASISLKVFLEGLESISLNEEYSFAERDEKSLEKIMKLIRFIEDNTIEQLWEHRTTKLLFVYEDIMRAIKFDLAKQRFERVYSQSSDPYRWYLLSQKHKELFVGGHIPFGLTTDRLRKLTDKISTILTTVINPY